MTTIEKLITAPRHVRAAAEDAVEAVLRGEPEPLLASQAQSARMLNCSRFTVARMEKDGTLHPVTIRGMKRYRVSELRALAAGGFCGADLLAGLAVAAIMLHLVVSWAAR